MSSPDPRAVQEYRIPAASLRPGDLVNLSPGEDDWQQVLAVYAAPADVKGDNADMRTLVETLDKRYVVVELTDLSPVDEPVYFADGVAHTVSPDDNDEAVTDVVSSDYGVRTFIYTKFELVTVRSAP